MSAARSRANGNGQQQQESIDYAIFNITLSDEQLEKLADKVAARVFELTPDPAADPWIGAREAAEHLGIHYSTVKQRAAAGEISAYQDAPGGSLWFKRSELDEWRRSHG